MKEAFRGVSDEAHAPHRGVDASLRVLALAAPDPYRRERMHARHAVVVHEHEARAVGQDERAGLVAVRRRGAPRDLGGGARRPQQDGSALAALVVARGHREQRPGHVGGVIGYELSASAAPTAPVARAGRVVPVASLAPGGAQLGVVGTF